MRLRILAFVMFIAFLASSGASVLAQDGGDHRYSVDSFSFTISPSVANRLNVAHYLAEAVDMNQPDMAQPEYTEIVMYNEALQGATVPSPFDAVGSIWVYQVADLVGYNMAQATVQQLQRLLNERPDLALYMAVQEEPIDSMPTLPFLPILPAGQVIRARATYIELPSIKGIAYVTVYREDMGPFTADEFLYTFQGLSNDGKVYISAQWSLNASMFPQEYPSVDLAKFQETVSQYFRESVVKLNNAAPGDFTPSLNTLDAMIQSFEIA